ncbi:MAG: hypothetical protein ACLGHM_09055 [Actinomycetes bacterium]
MAAAMLVAMVAGVDLAMWQLRGGARALAVAAWLAAVLAGGVILGDVAPWWAAGASLGAALWVAVHTSVGADAAAGVLLAGTAVLLLAGDGPDRAAAIVATVAVAAFLAHGANDVCRDVIRRARATPEESDEPGDPPADPSRLRGGRFIGPLERWLIVALALVGAEGVIVGLMAAKGIGRFPEISGDRARGSAAEEFLVGSLVSWALAGAGALLIATLW